MAVELSKVDRILDQHNRDPRHLIPALIDVQSEYSYLPPEALRLIAEGMRIPPVRVYQVASFYKTFSLEPQGKHIITVCEGTSCHVRGVRRLADHVERLLEIEPGQTTKDQQFTLETVKCLGVCALGPVMVLDGKYYGMMNTSKVEQVLKHLAGREEDSVNG